MIRKATKTFLNYEKQKYILNINFRILINFEFYMIKYFFNNIAHFNNRVGD